MRYILLLLLVLMTSQKLAFALDGIDGSTFEAEDFEVQEEGMMFDHSRTGLIYRRNLYIDDDNVTFLPQQPTQYNDTQDVDKWTVHISKWEYDPPSSIVIYVTDDTPLQTSGSLIDLKVRIGQHDRNGNLVVANTVVRTDIPIQSGLNRILINIHNYAGDVFSAHLTGVRPKMAYQPVE